jgi:hypothetical protein
MVALSFRVADNGLQISEGTNSVGIVRLDLGFCLCAVMRSPYFFRVDYQQVRSYFKNKSKIL